MVISQVNQNVYNGDGINKAWPYTFRIIDATDIKLTIVAADGTETNVTADYYVDTVNNTVYYPGYAPGAEPPEEDQPPKVQTGQKIIVYRQLPVNQLANLGEKWPFYVIEKGLDKLTMLIQQMKDVWNRCLKISVGSMANAGEDFDATIPVEAGKVFRVNDEGTGFTIAEDYRELAQEAQESATIAINSAISAKESADRAYRITPEALRWMENFVVGADGKFYQVMER